MLAFPAHCAATREQAFAEARPVAEGILAVVIAQYLALAEGGGKDYAYLEQMRELDAHKTDIEYVIHSDSPPRSRCRRTTRAKATGSPVRPIRGSGVSFSCAQPTTG